MTTEVMAPKEMAAKRRRNHIINIGIRRVEEGVKSMSKSEGPAGGTIELRVSCLGIWIKHPCMRLRMKKGIIITMNTRLCILPKWSMFATILGTVCQSLSRHCDGILWVMILQVRGHQSAWLVLVSISKLCSAELQGDVGTREGSQGGEAGLCRLLDGFAQKTR